MNASATPTSGSAQRSSRRLPMLLLECGRIVRDSWQKLADVAARPSAGCVLGLFCLPQVEAVAVGPHLGLCGGRPDAERAGALTTELDSLAVGDAASPTF